MNQLNVKVSRNDTKLSRYFVRVSRQIVIVSRKNVKMIIFYRYHFGNNVTVSSHKVKMITK